MLEYLKLKFKQCTNYFTIKEVDSKNVRRAIYHYLYNNNSMLWQNITKVDTFETTKGLIIVIETHRPGLLIGKGGEFIDGLENWLKIDHNRNDITIDIKESKLWSKLY